MSRDESAIFPDGAGTCTTFSEIPAWVLCTTIGHAVTLRSSSQHGDEETYIIGSCKRDDVEFLNLSYFRLHTVLCIIVIIIINATELL
jgi:hypothetical protein